VGELVPRLVVIVIIIIVEKSSDVPSLLHKENGRENGG